MKHLSTTLFFLLFVFTAFTQVRFYKGQKIETGTIIIKLSIPLKKMSPQSGSADLQNIFKKYPPKKIFAGKLTQPLSQFVEIKCSDEMHFEKTLNHLNSLDEVEYAEPRYIPEPMHVPSDKQISSQYYLEKIEAYKAWDISISDTSIIVAISDEGFDLSHYELVNKIAYNYNDIINGIDDDNDGYIDNFRGWDLGENDNSPHSLTLTHGTQVSGILCAEADNEMGIAGVGYKVKFLPVKVTNEYGQFTRSYESIAYAANAGADIINCSWGGTAKHLFGKDIIDYALNKGCIIVAAAGNSNDMSYYYPASYKGVLSVAGTTANDERWSPENSTTLGGSTYNEFVDICAPASNILSLNTDNKYMTIAGGSSASCPMVSGALALMKTYYPEYSNKQLIQQLLSSADVIDTSEFNMPFQGMLGAGRLNCYNALTELYTGIVVEDLQFSNEGNNSFNSGDTITVKGRISNYLEKGYNVSIILTTQSSHLQAILNVIVLDSIEKDHNGTLQELFSFVIKESAPFNFKQNILISIKNEGKVKKQYEEFFCNSTETPFSYGNISTWVNSNGRFGQDQREYCSLKYKNKNLLSECGLIMKDEFDEVLTSINGNNLFSAQSLPKYNNTDTAYMYTSSYRDILGLNYSIANKTWIDKTYTFDHILFEYIITNSAETEKLNNFAGVYFDWDIEHSYSNFIVYDSVRKLQTIHSTIIGAPVAGLLGLKNTNGFYALDNLSGISYRSRFLLEEQAECISSNNFETNKQVFGDDIATIIWGGPFNLEKHSSDTISFIAIFAPSEDSVTAIADLLIKKDKPHISSSSNNFKEVTFFTTFTQSNILYISTHLYSGKIALYSASGQLIDNTRIENGSAHFNVEQLPKGIYLLQTQSAQGVLNRAVYID